MTVLVEFLRARLAEDEEAARDAVEGPWWEEDTSARFWGDQRDAEVSSSRGRVAVLPYDKNGGLNAAHIARHDPARVLAEVEAKRRILDDVLPTMQADELRIAGEWGIGADPAREASDDLLSMLALPYADHPDYREEWAP